MRYIIAIVVLIVLGMVAAIAAIVLMTVLQKQNGDVGIETLPSEVTILVAARDMPAMTIVDTSSVQKEDIQAQSVPVGAFTEPAQVVGRVLAVPVKEGQAFTRSLLAKEGTGSHLAGILTPGQRAVSVSLTDYAALKGLLYPGSVVDVIASFTLSTRERVGEAVSTTLIESAQVLAVNEETVFTQASEEGETVPQAAPSRSTRTNLIVTLLVDTKQAEALQLAMEYGSIVLALRNPTDSMEGIRDATLLSQGQLAEYATVMSLWVDRDQPPPALEPEPVPEPEPEPEPEEIPEVAVVDLIEAITSHQMRILRGTASEIQEFSLPDADNLEQ